MLTEKILYGEFLNNNATGCKMTDLMLLPSQCFPYSIFNIDG